MAGSLDEPIRKLSRAIEHAVTLKHDVLGGRDGKFHRLIGERHDEGREYRFRIGYVEPINPAVVLLVGDIFFNLRASLDYLAYQLHVRRFRGRVPSDVERDSQFPIYPTRLTPKGNARRWESIESLAEREQASIKWLQPYNRRDDDLFHTRRFLYEISVINNVDKHRALHVVSRYVDAVAIPKFPRDLGFKRRPTPLIALESDAYVDGWTFQVPTPPEYVNMHPGLNESITLDVGGRIQSTLLPYTHGSINAVATVLHRFERCFPPAEFPNVSF